MKLVIQRVSKATVSIDNAIVATIKNGLVVLLGVKKGDSINDVDFLVNKVANLRILSDANGKLNISILDTKGSLLIVPNFTIYADAQTSRRPSFDECESFENANKLFDKFCNCLHLLGIDTQRGVFGADMQVELVNDGPVTMILHSLND